MSKASDSSGCQGGGKKKATSWWFYIFGLPIVVALSLVYTPGFWVTFLIYVDFYTPWILFESKAYDAYHDFLVSRLSERPELPIPTISPEEATTENLIKLSNGYTFPVIIKGLLVNSTSLTDWASRDW